MRPEKMAFPEIPELRELRETLVLLEILVVTELLDVLVPRGTLMLLLDLPVPRERLEKVLREQLEQRETLDCPVCLAEPVLRVKP